MRSHCSHRRSTLDNQCARPNLLEVAQGQLSVIHYEPILSYKVDTGKDIDETHKNIGRKYTLD